MTEQIFQKAKSLLGDACRNEAALREGCAAACAELTSRLREGVSPEDLGEVFTAAAGALALSFYVQLGDASEISGFKAGDVSVTRRGAGSVRNSAAALRNQAETMLAAWLTDRGFDFRGVLG